MTGPGPNPTTRASKPAGPPIVVVGGGLAGLSAAVRLAKAGHPVRIYEAADHLGGHWAARTVELAGRPVVVDDAPSVLEFPAPWRDLYRKSGRTLADELGRSGTALAAAEPAAYVFADGAEVLWPTDRGELFGVHERRYGTATASRWRGLINQLDDVWQTVRRLGWEVELTGRADLTGPVRRQVWADRTMADLASQIGHPHLAAVLRAAAYRLGGEPESTPAWCAVALSVERRFGRWTIHSDAPAHSDGTTRSDAAPDRRDRTGRSSTLVDGLVERARIRRVAVRLGERVVRLDLARGRPPVVVTAGERVEAAAVVWTADPWQLRQAGLPRLRGRALHSRLRRLRPALAPTVTHRLLAAEESSSAGESEAAGRVSETVTLDADGVPTLSYRRPVTAGTLLSVHDWQSRTPDPSAGADWRGFDSWLDRPPIRAEIDRLLLAGPWSRAGNSAPATLLAGALASYAAHELGAQPAR